MLIGGGHTHSLVLRQLADKPLADVRVTLISDVEHAAYSGMLPGHVAGFYTHEEMHIDLRKLCQRAHADFIHANVNALDLENHRALQDGKRIGPAADILSINIGSTPGLHRVPGMADCAIPSKPVPQLLAGWERLRTAAAAGTSAQPLRVVVVGGGAGGVELTLAMESRTSGKAEFTIVHGGPHLLAGHNERVRNRLSAVLARRGVAVLLHQRVSRVESGGVHLQSGAWHPADFVFQVTQPTPAPWLRESGLALTEEGFIRVQPTLQALHHPWIFAAGDIATLESKPTPKSGVFAVRMAVPLEANLRAAFLGKPLSSYKPQKNFLSLIGTADGRAVASRGWLAWHSTSMWRLKDWIDRRFMRQF